MFIVLLKGEGTGCDYTIECNRTWKKLNAETLEEAQKEVEKMVGRYSEPGIEEAIILNVNGMTKFDVVAYRKKRRQEIAAEKARKHEEEQRRIYEQLKQKFG